MSLKEEQEKGDEVDFFHGGHIDFRVLFCLVVLGKGWNLIV